MTVPNKGFALILREISLTVMIVKLFEFELDRGRPCRVLHDLT